MFDIKQTTADYMSLVLTHECNKKCPFCIDRYRGRLEYISREHVIAACEHGVKHGIKDVLLIGGEPTLHPNVVEIAQLVKSYGFRVIMTTNYTMPDVVKALDGIVDCFNISFYHQPSLPLQANFNSDLTLHTLIHTRQLETKEKLDAFIEKHRGVGHIKFSTLSPCNQWATDHQLSGGYLDALPCEWVVLFNEILGQIYNGATIKRYDRVINKIAHQSFKCHVDGEISDTWERNLSA
jgi:hypothetical protein